MPSEGQQVREEVNGLKHILRDRQAELAGRGGLDTVQTASWAGAVWPRPQRRLSGHSAIERQTRGRVGLWGGWFDWQGGDASI